MQGFPQSKHIYGVTPILKKKEEKKKKEKNIKQAPSSVDMLTNQSRNLWQVLWTHYKPTGVFPGVSDERAGHSEGHAAGVADVRFLSRVSSLVVH